MASEFWFVSFVVFFPCAFARFYRTSGSRETTQHAALNRHRGAGSQPVNKLRRTKLHLVARITAFPRLSERLSRRFQLSEASPAVRADIWTDKRRRSGLGVRAAVQAFLFPHGSLLYVCHFFFFFRISRLSGRVHT